MEFTPTLTEATSGNIVWMSAVAIVVSFAAFLTGFRLADRAREATGDGMSGWLFMGSVACGAGLWSSNLLVMSAIGGGALFSANLLLASLFLAVATAFAGLSAVLRSRRTPAVMGAGLAVAIGNSLVMAVGVASIALEPPTATRPMVLLAVGGVVFLAATLAHAIAGSSRRDRWFAVAGFVMALAVAAANASIMLSVDLAPHARIVAGGQAVGTAAVAMIVALALFLVVGSGMATNLIDREGQYASQRRLRQMANASVEGIVIADGGKIVEVNESFQRLVGMPAAALVGGPLIGRLLATEVDGASDITGQLSEGHLTAADGRQVPVEVISRDVDYEGRPHRVYAVRDLSDRRDAELRIRFLAEHDTLTGLPNRACFQNELEKAVAGLAEGGSRFALLCLDLDRFKEANDVFGHLAGDAVLVQVGARLRELFGSNAFVARLGGDEFVVMLPDVASPRLAGDRAEQIVAAMAVPFVHDGQRIAIGTSVGIAIAPHDGDAADVLLARADMALYRAKSEGRGTFCFFEVAMDEETRLRRSLAFDLRDAIELDQLELYYQPLANLEDKEIIGFEALVRWHHPRHGTVSPTIFVTIAEESGFIAQLGDWVLRTACREAASWKRPLRIAVNLSPIQLEQQNLPEQLHEILLNTGLSPGRLEIEVTEGAVMRNPQRSLDVLRRIKALGVRVAMDDFGTGYSSLSTLQSFPFDKLKIDRSFVDRVGTHEQAASIVRAVVGLSRSLDIRVLAEGVETEAQIRFLAGESCDEVQGYMIGRPMPIEVYAEVTRQGGIADWTDLRAVG